jgi:hypothetical protein
VALTMEGENQRQWRLKTGADKLLERVGGRLLRTRIREGTVRRKAHCAGEEFQMEAVLAASCRNRGKERRNGARRALRRSEGPGQHGDSSPLPAGGERCQSMSHEAGEGGSNWEQDAWAG